MGDLTVLRVKNAKPGEKLTDGGGLRLDVDRNGNGSWIFRFKSPVTGKERFMGLPYASLPRTPTPSSLSGKNVMPAATSVL